MNNIQKAFFRNNVCTIGTDAQAKKFINSLKELSNSEGIHFLASERGEAALLKCLNILGNNNWNYISFLFQYLVGNHQNIEGLQKDQALRIFSIVGKHLTFLDELRTAIECGRYSDGTEAISYILCRLACDAKFQNDNPRAMASIQELGRFILAQGNVGADEADMLRTVFHNSPANLPGNLPTFEMLQKWKPLHDNDDVDNFRNIQVPPTISELNLTDLSVEQMYRGWREPEENRLKKLLDRQFRLLRGDMLGCIREEILNWKNDSSGKTSVPVFNRFAIQDMGCDIRTGACVNVKFRLPRAMTAVVKQSMVLLKVKKEDKKEGEKKGKEKSPVNNQQSGEQREESKYILPNSFFEESGQYILPINSMILFVDDKKDVIAMGIVADRDKIEMAREAEAQHSQRDLLVTVGLKCDDQSLRFLLSLFPISNDKEQPQYSAIQIRSSIFNYEFVLKNLQEMFSVPFCEELTTGQPMNDYSFFNEEENIRPPDAVMTKLASSPSQREAFHYALSKRIALIQGPPGTGKTFLGVQLVQTLLTDPSVKILCICYTNHALDSFLESLLHNGIKSTTILRLGSTRKISSSLQACTVRGQRQEFSRGQKSSYGECKANLSSLSSSISDNLKILKNLASSLFEYLENLEDEDILQQFDTADIDGGYINIHKNGKKLTRKDLWSKWLKGDARPRHLPSIPSSVRNIWELCHEERIQLNAKWHQAYHNELVDTIMEDIGQYNSWSKLCENLRQSSLQDEMRGKQIVACTTSYAAKNNSALKSQKFDVVLVEEAAEILESHILVNLGSSVKRLIMIGDHKQLRPKLEHYPLRVDSGQGIDFDRSLFERLVLMGYPFATLDTQHRMRPEISKNILYTYPELKDHRSTLHREDVMGMQRNVAFITHSELESRGNEDLGIKSLSKSNIFEVNMIMKMLIYLLQQGYKTDDIVILTPYLGQLMELRKALSKNKLDSVVSELDGKDLLNAGVQLDTQCKETVKSEKTSVRVSTIDNFQGEESKIILATLVRSNVHGEAGFVKGAERVNVLLSRARDGFYLIGNSATLRQNKNSVWNTVLDNFAEDGCLLPGFPIRCPIHDVNRLLKKPEDFDKYAENGGCNEICTEKLPCAQHSCNKACHPHHGKIADHSKERCSTLVDGNCKRGHVVQRWCFSSVCFPCHESIETICPQGHTIAHKCCAVNPFCKVCDKKRKMAKKMKNNLDKILQEIVQIELQTASIDETIVLERKMEDLKLRKSSLQANLIALSNETKVPQNAENCSIVKFSIADNIESAKIINRGKNELATKVETVDIDHTSSARAMNPVGAEIDKTNSDILVHYAQTREWPPFGDSHRYTRRNLTLKKIWESSLIKGLPLEVVLLRLWVAIEEPQSDENDDDLRNAFFRFQDTVPINEIESRRTESNWPCIPALLNYLQVNICMKFPELLALAKSAFADMLNNVNSSEYKEFLRFVPDSWIEETREWLDSVSISSVVSAPTLTDNDPIIKWDEIKRKHNSAGTLSEAMDFLMKMTGLNSVKRQCIDFFITMSLLKEQGGDLHDKNFNTRFNGNPGTGKTTVANLFCQILIDFEVLPPKVGVFKKTGSELITMGVTGLQKQLETMKEAGGGIVFVDEAYQLSDRSGKSMLDFILGHSERFKGEYGCLVWILAGYNRQMDDLFKLNPGLPSRFPKSFLFEDYTDQELVSIFNGMMQRKPSPTFPTTKEKVKKKEIITRSSTPAGSNSNSYGYGYRYGSQKRQDEVDRWGNTWRWDPNNYTFEDDFGNITGYGVADFGTTRNPLVSRKDTKSYLFDESKKSWIEEGNPKVLLPGYPGKPIEKPNNLKPFTVDDAKYVRIAMRRIGRSRGVDGFANARAVRNLFDLAHERLNARVTKERTNNLTPDIFQFTRDDLLGPKATMATFETSVAWKELQALEGLEKVKESIRNLVQLVVGNADREEQEKPLMDVSLNRVFLGNPGTGKTTVARLYARLLKDLGMLSKGDIFLKTASDFVGSVLGKSEEITRGILQEATGSVLVIDEAYGLYSASFANGNEPYREAVINTLVEQIQGKPGEDRAVILIGYREEMEVMMRHVNPGLSRRFQLDQAFEFQDYDDEALVTILTKSAKNAGLKITPETATFAVSRLGKARAMPHFGNAGAVDNLLSEAKLRYNKRIMESKAKKMFVNESLMIKVDFVPEGFTEEIIEPSALLEAASLVGCETIREKLTHYCNVIKFNKANNRDIHESVCFNFVFTGAPGTGKTSVARLMGKMFHSLGMLPTNEVVEVSLSDLLTGFVGQAGNKTRDQFRAAKGKVLFIDEAYQLNPKGSHSYAQEVVDEIVKLLTHEDYKNKLVVILAGYEQEIHEMLDVNAGLRSRFTEYIAFQNFTAQQVVDMIVERCKDTPGQKKKVLPLSPSLLQPRPSSLSTATAAAVTPNDDLTSSSLYILATRMVAMPKFANGRDVDTLIKKAEQCAITRITRTSQGENALSAEDFWNAFDHMAKAQQPAAAPKQQSKSHSPPALASSTASLPPVTPPTQQRQQQAIEAAAPSVAVDIVSDTAPEETADTAASDTEDAQQSVPDLFNSEYWKTKHPKRVLTALQEVLDRHQWSSSRDKLRQLATSDLAVLLASDVEVATMFHSLVDLCDPDMSFEEVFAVMQDWQKTQRVVEEQERRQQEEMAKAQQEQRLALVPIWRCGVCGRADQPYIACYVQPYIVRYEERPLK